MLLHVKSADAEKNGNFTDIFVSKLVERKMFSHCLGIIFCQRLVCITTTCIPAIAKELDNTF